MGRLLSAFTTFPDNDLLVVGCDYPFLEQKDLKEYLNMIDGAVPAATFFEKGER